jgi:hypothetical protein
MIFLDLVDCLLPKMFKILVDVEKAATQQTSEDCGGYLDVFMWELP